MEYEEIVRVVLEDIQTRKATLTASRGPPPPGVSRWPAPQTDLSSDDLGTVTLLADARGEKDGRLATVGSVRHDSVPVLDEGVSHNIDITGRGLDVAAKETSNAHIFQRGVGPHLTGEGLVAQNKQVNVLSGERPNVEVKRVDRKVLSWNQYIIIEYDQKKLTTPAKVTLGMYDADVLQGKRLQ